MMTPSNSPFLDSVPRLKHGFFTRQGGVSEGPFQSLNMKFGGGDDDRHVQENRRRMAQHFGLPSAPVLTVNQVHGTDVVTVHTPWTVDTAPTADALVTDQPGLILTILTADCAPLLYVDPRAGIIGAAHAGWRSAFHGIVERTIEAMEHLGASADRTMVVIGPCIGQNSYQVDVDFKKKFLQQSQDNEAFFLPDTQGRFLFDLSAYVLNRLARLGVQKAAWTGHDTFRQEDLFFSYRRATAAGLPDEGRQASAIAWQPG